MTHQKLAEQRLQEIETILKQQSGIDVNTMLEPLKDLVKRKKYGLVWEEPNGSYEPEQAELALNQHVPFLKELDSKKVIGSDGQDHVLIEGDNLHALQAMQYTHKNKIDVIYIDPPYNTGNGDFVYNDKFVDKEDSWRHSSWLSFMNKRLKLARELMTDAGVIFISIDDNEMAQLKLLCDTVFGEENFIANTIRVNNAAKNNAKFVSVNHDYTLIYAKNKDCTLSGWSVKKNNVIEFEKICRRLMKNGLSNDEIERELRSITKYPRFYDFDHYTHCDARGPYRTTDSGAPSKGNLISEIIHPITNKPCKKPSKGWVYKDETIRQMEKDDMWHFGEDESVIPTPKRYLKDYMYQVPSGIQFYDSQIDKKNMRNNMQLDFSYPKPKDYIKFLMEMYQSKTFTVLDFFAGSGTTGHAVMELNKEDGGNRQFILCTNNEVSNDKEVDKMVELNLLPEPPKSKRSNAYKQWLDNLSAFRTTDVYQQFIQSDDYQDLGIARAVTHQRIEKVIKGYTTPNGKDVDGLMNNNLTYFTVDLKELTKDMEYDAYVLIKETIDLIRLKENIYTTPVVDTIDDVPVSIVETNSKRVLVVLDSDVLDEDLDTITDKYVDNDRDVILYTSHHSFEKDGFIKKELPKELIRALEFKGE